jgi:hypothetical protein
MTYDVSNLTNNDEQVGNNCLFMAKRCPSLLPPKMTKKQLKFMAAKGQIDSGRMAENYFAILENTECCEKKNQRGYDLKNKTEVKSATTSISGLNAVAFKIQGLTSKAASHHIMAIIYNDVLKKTQVLKITKPSIIYDLIAQGKGSYHCGINRETGDINGLQEFIIDEG